MIKQALAAFHTCMHARGRLFVILASLVGTVAALSVMGAWAALSHSPATMTADDVALQFCAPPPKQAQVESQAIPNEEVDVRVPGENTSSTRDSPAIDVRLGDIVKFTVVSDRGGAVGVHGLSTIKAIHPGGLVAIQFRAIYSGRFPLHFHGTDGSHFELIAVNVTVR